MFANCWRRVTTCGHERIGLIAAELWLDANKNDTTARTIP